MSQGEEVWLPIPGYEGRYDVSDQGRVRTWLQLAVPGVPQLMSPGLTRGYRHLALRPAPRQTDPHRVHRLVLLAFIGPCPAGLEVRHLDGNRTNNRLDNLVYGTKSENMRDQVRHGTHVEIRKTHCPAGHAYSGDNVAFGPRGNRRCRACDRIKHQLQRRPRTPAETARSTELQRLRRNALKVAS